jgi:hypothetical protein
MFKTIVKTIREDQTHPFFVWLHKFLENPDVMGMLENSPGFISHEYSVSEDGLILTRITTWENEDSHYAFLYRWLDEHPEYILDYTNYNQEHQHVNVSTYETT